MTDITVEVFLSLQLDIISEHGWARDLIASLTSSVWTPGWFSKNDVKDDEFGSFSKSEQEMKQSYGHGINLSQIDLPE